MQDRPPCHWLRQVGLDRENQQPQGHADRRHLISGWGHGGPVRWNKRLALVSLNENAVETSKREGRPSSSSIPARLVGGRCWCCRLHRTCPIRATLVPS